MVVLSGSVPDGDLETSDVTEALAIAAPANHGLVRQWKEHEHLPEATIRGPKLDRPKVNIGVSAKGMERIQVSLRSVPEWISRRQRINTNSAVSKC